MDVNVLSVKKWSEKLEVKKLCKMRKMLWIWLSEQFAAAQTEKTSKFAIKWGQRLKYSRELEDFGAFKHNNQGQGSIKYHMN